MVQNMLYWQSGNLGFISALPLTCFVSLTVSTHLAEAWFLRLQNEKMCVKFFSRNGI